MDGKQELGLDRKYRFLSASAVLDLLSDQIRHNCWMPSFQGGEAGSAEELLTVIASMLEDSGRVVVDWQ